ncbi:hypothetical protein GGD61_005845 [Bradyrhizobium sp. SBR1B]|nr:hypothetical protein [Bradyrhizobium sp. SBR1B]
MDLSGVPPLGHFPQSANFRSRSIRDVAGVPKTPVVDHEVPFDADGGKRFKDVDDAATSRGRISTCDGVFSREDG